MVSDLFTNVCNILKDEVIIELKKNNDLLRKMLDQPSNPMRKYINKKVLTIEHTYFNETIPEMEGLLVCFSDEYRYGIIEIEINDWKKLKKIPLNYIKFT